MERFSNQSRKTKTNVINLASHKRNKHKMNQSEIEQIQVFRIKRGKTRVSKSRLFFYWLRKWCKLF